MGDLKKIKEETSRFLDIGLQKTLSMSWIERQENEEVLCRTAEEKIKLPKAVEENNSQLNEHMLRHDSFIQKELYRNKYGGRNHR